ncbi:trypsin-like serine protease [Allokutzneria multivorans]
MGWGRTCVDLNAPCSMSPELRRLDVKLVPNADSAMTTSKELCVSNPDGVSGPCGGDSGGPALVRANGRWELVGATSRPGMRQRERCGQGTGIYTDLAEHRAWVLDQL